MINVHMVHAHAAVADTVRLYYIEIRTVSELTLKPFRTTYCPRALLRNSQRAQKPVNILKWSQRRRTGKRGGGARSQESNAITASPGQRACELQRSTLTEPFPVTAPDYARSIGTSDSVEDIYWPKFVWTSIAFISFYR